MVQGTLKMVTKDPDAVAGGVLAAAGATGLSIQAITQGLNLAVVCINLLLGLGGLYLLFVRIRRARRQKAMEK
jgi:hypothetical protein